MAARTIGAIALRPTGNTQGGYFFFSLTTGRVLNRGRWTSLPMPNEVIDRVHRMARQEHGNNGLLFEDRNHNPLVDPYDDGDDDSTYHPEEGDDDSDDDDDNDDGDDDNPDIPHHPDEEQPMHNNPPDIIEDVDVDQNDQEAESDDNSADDQNLNNNDQNEEASTASIEEQIPNNHDDDEASALTNNDTGTPTMPNDPTLPPRAQRELNRLSNDGIGPTIYQGRTRSETHNMSTTGQLESSTPLPYQHMTKFERELFHRRIAGVRVPSEIGYEQNEVLRHTVLTQYTLKKGLQVFGPPGVEAVYRELQQLHQRKVGEPRDATKLSIKQKKNALGYLMFLKQKRTGQIKGRGCADGRKQRHNTPKDDASSPTVATESVLLSCVIDAKEQRDVATVDILGAFMQGDQDETVHMRLEEHLPNC